MNHSSNYAEFSPNWLVRQTLNPSRGDVVTFYSYKGGTGRSMALVNCAGLIARNLPTGTKPVLMIDFDLEAPGLHRYVRSMLPTANEVPAGTLELFEMLQEVISARLFAQRNGDPACERVDDEVCADIVDRIELAPYLTDLSGSGMWLIAAGRFDESYDRRLQDFDWKALFRQAPGLFRALAARFARDYSFTLIDARTGLSDTCGVCTMLLPDVLVAVFTPNNQSLTGIEHLVGQALEYRASSSDLRSLRVYPLVSRVDTTYEHHRVVWRRGALGDALFGDVRGYQGLFDALFSTRLEMPDGNVALMDAYFDLVQIPHSADYAYGERLCFSPSASSDRYSLRKSYEDFLPWLVTGAAPWEQPLDVLSRWQTEYLLKRVGPGVDSDDNESWREWFDRLAGNPDLIESPPVARPDAVMRDLWLGVEFAQMLAKSWGGGLTAATDLLRKVYPGVRDYGLSSQQVNALARLAKLWIETKSAAELGLVDRRSWLDAAGKLIGAGGVQQALRMKWIEVEAGWFEAIADYSEAEARLRQIVDSQRNPVGNIHPKILSLTADIARLRQRQGDLSQSRSLLEQTIGPQRELLGFEHPDTLTSMSHLANTLNDLGDLTGARALHEQVLDARRRVLGAEHADTLASMNNLAGTLWGQGDLSGARSLGEQVLEARRRTLGIDHPATLTSMGNLTSILWNQGERADARLLQEQTLQAMRDRLGPEHPDTLSSMSNLAGMLGNQGDLSGARELHEQVLDARRRSLGAEHPDTLSSMNNLASILGNQGNFASARSLHEQVLDGRRSKLGPEHPDTLSSMNNLAITLSSLEDWAGARKLQEDVLEARSRMLGMEHPDTLGSMNNLASTLWAIGDLDGARGIEIKVLEARRRVLGVEHPDTLNSMNNLAVTLGNQGDLVGAQALQEQALEAMRRTIGTEHPHVLSAINNLASTHWAQGNFSDAFALWEQALIARHRVLGANHPDTITNTLNLANAYLESGDGAAKSRALLEPSLESVIHTLGADDQHTIEIAELLSDTLERLGEDKAALEVLKRVRPTHKRDISNERF